MVQKVLTVGGGAREHVIAEALCRSNVEHYSVMSNNNPGIARLSKGVSHAKETDVAAVVKAALKWGIDLAVIGPEAPLGHGLADALEAKGIAVASPSRDAALLETSKSFCRELMERHGLPGRVRFGAFDSMEGVEELLDELDDEVAVKPVGLTGGKGVRISGEHLDGREGILAYCREIVEKGIGGGGFVIEEKLLGEEFTLQAFSDGNRIVALPAVQDHKRAFEGDTGPNTGGMGSYSQADHLLPFLTKEEYDKGVGIIGSTIGAMKDEGHPYRGVIYGQFMLTKDGPKVVEFNARFGDPEAMNVLPLLEGDYVKICLGMAEGDIPVSEVRFSNRATVCKYVVPSGYGIRSLGNRPLHVDEDAIAREGARLYYASVDMRDEGLFTTTSRSLGVVGVADTIEEAERIAESGLSHVKGEVFMRHDIGKQESLERKVAHMNAVRGS